MPLDYTSRDGRTTTLALIRRPADDPGARQGSIFVNPGGPGVGGVGYVAENADVLFGPEVLARFDVIGFDPRGIAGSNPLQCFENNEELLAYFSNRDFQQVWPEIAEEYRAAIRDSLTLRDDCEQMDHPLLDNMGTTTVARDLDVLRRAVGDPQLNFLGQSYGTYLCAQYHAQYPDRVGALICDSNIDPVEYATGEPTWQGFFVPNLARARAEVGANASLEEIFRLCDQAATEDEASEAEVQRCPFGPDSETRYEALQDSLEESPLERAGTPFDERALIATSIFPLYSSIGGWAALGGLLAELETEVATGGQPALPPPPAEEPAPPTEGPVIGLFALKLGGVVAW